MARRILAFITGVVGWLILAFTVSAWAAVGVSLITIGLAISIQAEINNLKGEQ